MPASSSAEDSEWLQVLWEKSPAAIYRTDASGRCLWVNKKWSELTGRARETSLGDGWREAVHPEDRERLSREWIRPFAERASFVSEYRYLRPDGTVRWVLGRATAHLGPDDELLGYIGVTVDITELRQSRKPVKEIASESESPALSRREREVAGLLAEGSSNKVVAKRLAISVRTAEAHRARIMRKLRISSLAALVRYAIKNGLTDK